VTGSPLERDRALGALLDDTVGILRRHIGTALLLTAAVVIPVELLVSGIGLGQLTSSYSDAPSSGGTVFSSLVSVLVTTPLVMGMLMRLVLDDAAGEKVSAARCARTGLDGFAPLLLAVLLATAGIVLGLVAFIVPGIFLAVRFVVVAPVVLVEGRHGTEALARSWALVRGNGWWVLGTMFVLALIVGVLGTVIQLPAEAAAKAADAQALSLAGTIVGQVLGLPFSAVGTILLFFTLRARERGRTGAAPESPASSGRGEGREDGGGEGEPPLAAPAGWEPPVPPR
jgi:hypothetical protein